MRKFEMRVRVDETGQNRRRAEIFNFCFGKKRQNFSPRADGDDFIGFDGDRAAFEGSRRNRQNPIGAQDFNR